MTTPPLRRFAVRIGCGSWWLPLILVPLTVVVPSAAAHDLSPWMGRPATERKHFQGSQFARAGNPQCVSPLAKPTESPHEQGYYVGGGAREHARGGEERHPLEGTWGVDYTGIVVHKRTNLGWWHGGRYQGGVGSYPTDGPRVLHRP